MKTGEDFLNEQNNNGLQLLRVDKDENKNILVTFFGGLDSIGVMEYHKFWPTDSYGRVIEKGGKFPNENMVQFECFKSIFNDEDAFCPGCSVQNHVGTRPEKMYYAPVIRDGDDKVYIFEMKYTIGKDLRDIIKREFLDENDLESLPNAVFRVMRTDTTPYYVIELTRKTADLEDEPEVPNMNEFLKTIRVTRTLDDVLTQMETENLWNEDIAAGAELNGYVSLVSTNGTEVT